MKIFIVNGPNLNMLGIRERPFYGTGTYNDLLALIEGASKPLGITADCFQSNHEGKIVEAIQKAYGVYEAIIINAAAYTHTSVAILDALKAVALPTVEVHLTDINNREDFRKFSYVSLYAQKVICGKGTDGYAEALKIWRIFKYLKLQLKYLADTVNL